VDIERPHALQRTIPWHSAAPWRLWTLYYHRHTGRWERYPLLGPSGRLGDLLTELAEDPICVFWG
jgi:hypothetical protein